MSVGNDEVGAAGRSRWTRGPLRPFRHRQYRWLASASAFELAGDGVWVIAIVWQVIALGGGPAQLSFAVTGFALGIVATALVGGVVADRVPQRRIMLTTAVVRLTVVVAVASSALAGVVSLGQLALASLVIGATVGFYFPAYSAMLPAIVDEKDLLAANGFEGFLRPVLQHAGGPAAGSLVVAASSPAGAFALVAALQVGCLLSLSGLRPVPLRHGGVRRAAGPTGAFRTLVDDLGGGVRYMVSTPWFLATLLFACVMLLLVTGPMEVLIPFVVKEGGGDPRGHALVLAAYGAGSAVSSLATGALPMPRRYLTVMNAMWGLACLPLLVVAVTSSVPAIAAAMFVVGVLMSAPMVLWGTLLQRRVPPELLGRTSSLDFFVSLLLMPVSIAVVGPLGEAVGIRSIFLVAAVIPLGIAAIAIVAARMPADEVAHPLT